MRRGLFRTGLLFAGTALVLTACQSVDQAAVDAEPYECPLGSEGCDVNRPIGDGGAMSVEAFEWGFNIVAGAAIDGAVEITFENVGGATHNIHIDEAAGEVKEVQAPAGATETGTLELFAGEYTYYCSIPGHRAQGMEGTITVFENQDAALQAGAQDGSDTSQQNESNVTGATNGQAGQRGSELPSEGPGAANPSPFIPTAPAREPAASESQAPAPSESPTA